MRQLFSCQQIKPVKGNQCHDDRKNQSDTRHHQGFSDELPDQLHPGRTHGFPDADFFGPLSASRRAQIHEIDTGED